MNNRENNFILKNKSINPDTLFRVLDLIEGNSKITQRELAKKTGVSLGSVNYCLKGLLKKGYIKINNLKTSSYNNYISIYMVPQNKDIIISKNKILVIIYFIGT